MSWKYGALASEREGATELGEYGGSASTGVRVLQNGVQIVTRRHGNLQPIRRHYHLPASLHHRLRDPQKHSHHQPQGNVPFFAQIPFSIF